MAKIRIAIAYRGLIHLAFWLASLEEKFKAHFELVFADGDEQALDLLMDRNGGCDIAICDPFAKSDIQGLAKKKLGSKDAIKLIGCIIDKSPVWIYRNHWQTVPVHCIRSTDELKDYDLIKVIRGYESPNTGWIFCMDLESKLRTKEKYIRVIPVNFNPDVEDVINPGEVLLTSNILKIAVTDHLHPDSPGSCIYSYANSKDPNEGLKDLFFSGILARADGCVENRADYLVLFSLLKQSIRKIYETPVEQLVESYKDFFKEHTKNYPSIVGVSDEDLKQIFAKVILRIREEKLYPEDLTPKADKFERMKKIRKEFNKNLDNLDFYEFQDPGILEASNPVTRRRKHRWARFRQKYLRLFFYAKFFSLGFMLLNLVQIIPIVIIWESITHEAASATRIFLFWLTVFLLLLIDFIILKEVKQKKPKKEESESGENETSPQEVLWGANFAILFGLVFEIIK